jgi:hypothetical protein
MRKALTAAAAILIASLLLAPTPLANSPDADASASKFVPADYAGTWTGTWENQTFDTTGPASMVLKVKGKGKKRMYIGTFELGGNAFGCESLPPRTVKMKKGKGDDTWNKKGFRASWSNDFGEQHIAYEQATKRFSGDGVSPCNGDLAYTYEGKMTKTKVNADVDITYQGDPFADSTLELNKE